ncbi:helix-turn-helix domain-containing protein [Rhodopirellula halodulae]|uniref:helix-turn-helix domain-containing protein n=1 Tax=Rhodopirellula halodulae TaxID=2894198 RepID=UPI001E641BF2
MLSTVYTGNVHAVRLKRSSAFAKPLAFFFPSSHRFSPVAARQPQFSPKQIAAAMNVSESSVKRWCDNGTIPVIKTAGGHRRITLDSLQAFVSGGDRCLIRPELLGLPPLAIQRETRIEGSSDPLSENFRHALAEGDESLCRDLMQQKIASGATRSEAAEALITDAMHGFGEAWDCNTLDVYQERRGCDIAMRLIYELRSEIPAPGGSAPVAIGGAPEGDPYQLPTMLVELALREVGWNATSLGNDLPMESFIQAALDYDPQMVWLSVSSVSEPGMFVAAQNQFAESLGEDVPLLIGGRALSDKLRPRLRYTAHCDSLRNLVELAAMMRLNRRSN